jgi:hypothetical protein
MAITNGAAANSKRNRDICKMLDTKKPSYSIIAKMMRTTRNAVSGVAFRRRHPGLKKVGVGRGHGKRTYYPEKTLHVSL